MKNRKFLNFFFNLYDMYFLISPSTDRIVKSVFCKILLFFNCYYMRKVNEIIILIICNGSIIGKRAH